MSSLERSIISRIILTLVVVGGAAIAVTYQVARYEAAEFMDDHLRQFAHVTDPTAIGPATSRDLREPEDHFERLVWKDGVRIATTARAPDIATPPDKLGFLDFRSGGENWRGYAVRRKGLLVILAQRERAREELAQHAALQVSVVILVSMLVVWLVVRWTVGRTMRRFDLLSGTIAARGVDAKEPLPSDALPNEFRPLVDAMNILITRLQAALQQQKRFVADSAHELRTPLTALRIQIDNLRDIGAGESAAATLALREGIARAGGVLNQLLRLARFEGRESTEPTELVNLGEALTQSIADIVGIADDAGIDIGITKAAEATVMMVRADLQLLIANIIDNAIRYVSRGGVVDCAVLRDDRGATIRVTDDGPGVPEDLIPRLTERFFRAASVDLHGSGLGLAIVKAIAESYGLGLEIANRPDRSGLIVSVFFARDLLSQARQSSIDSGPHESMP